MSRNVQELEDEIGVDLLRRGPRGVSLTAEGKLFLEEARELLKRADESVERVRALARGEYGELQVGYSATPSWEILPDALATFRKAVPRVKLILHDLFDDEIVARLRDGTLELGVNAAGNLQRIAREGVAFTDYYGQQSCTDRELREKTPGYAFLAFQLPPELDPGKTKVGWYGQ